MGRGSRAGYCGILLGEERTKRPASGLTRLPSRPTARSSLAELDFALGAGRADLFGTQQHGLPPVLRIADSSTDRDVLEEARRERSCWSQPIQG